MNYFYKICILVIMCFPFLNIPLLNITNAAFANTRPQIISVSAPPAVEDSQYSLEITIQDDDLTSGDSLSFIVYDRPAWFNPGYETTEPVNNQITATFTGTPTDEIPNSYPIVIEVKDSINTPVQSDLITINIQNINDQPSISGDLPVSTVQNLQFSFKPVIEDPDTQPKYLDVAWTTDTDPKPEWLSILPLYTITDNTLRELESQSLPVSIIDSLRAIKDIEYIGETGFIEGLNNKIGTENTETYKTIIINNTYISGWTLTGTPANMDVGIIENIVISVSDNLDDNGSSDSTIDAFLPGFDLCVLNSNDPPVFQTQAPAGLEILHGNSFSLSLSATDPDLELLDTLTALDSTAYWNKCWPGNEINDSLAWNTANPPYTLLNGPEWLQIVSDPENPNGARLVNVAGRPDNDDVGIHNDIEILVSDGQGKTGRLDKFNINVKNINDPPVFVYTPTSNVEIYEDQEISFKYTPTGVMKTNIIRADDPDFIHGEQLTFSIAASTKPIWLNIEPVSDNEAKLTGVPANKDVGIYNNITLIVSDDEGASATYSFNLQVNNVNDPPEFIQVPAYDSANPVVINEGASFKMLSPEVIAVAQDIDDGDDIFFRINIIPSSQWLSVTTVPDESAVIATATAKFDGIPGSGDAGTYQVEIIAEDNSGAEASTIFHVKVNGVNTGPRITTVLPTTLTAYEDQAFSQKVVVEDNDLPDDNITVSLADNPSWLSVYKENNQNLQLRGTPIASDAGVYKNISLTVKDTAGESDYKTFNIEVIEVNDSPVISGKLPSAIMGRNYYFLPEAWDEEGDELIFSISFLTDEAPWLQMNPLTGELSGIPTELKGYFITIDVSDGNDGFAQLGPLLLNVITGPGDIDGSRLVDLKDVILALQITAGINPVISPAFDADVNEDGVLGLEEAVYILNSIAGN